MHIISYVLIHVHIYVHIEYGQYSTYSMCKTIYNIYNLLCIQLKTLNCCYINFSVI